MCWQVAWYKSIPRTVMHGTSCPHQHHYHISSTCQCILPNSRSKGRSRDLYFRLLFSFCNTLQASPQYETIRSKKEDPWSQWPTPEKYKIHQKRLQPCLKHQQLSLRLRMRAELRAPAPGRTAQTDAASGASLRGQTSCVRRESDSG